MPKSWAAWGGCGNGYPTIAQFYDIQGQHRDGKVHQIIWEIREPEKLQATFSGSYYLRSNRQDLSDRELWSLYIMLTQVEEAFRALKSELGLRPVYHRLDRRLEGHLFITVLSYHLLATIQRQLKQKGLSYRWQTIRSRLATQMRLPSPSPMRRENVFISGKPLTLNPFIWRSSGL